MLSMRKLELDAVIVITVLAIVVAASELVVLVLEVRA
jgi:hypothetical protein